MVPAAQVFKVCNMRYYCRSHFWILDIRDTKILASLFYNLADSRVMYMGYPGKKMMFYLEI